MDDRNEKHRAAFTEALQNLDSGAYFLCTEDELDDCIGESQGIQMEGM
jgi:hypothetical protein